MPGKVGESVLETFGQQSEDASFLARTFSY